MKIADIVLRERFRKSFGDIESLAADIKDIGLINPVTVNTEGVLLDGQRRLKAAMLLGWEKIDVRVIDTSRPLHVQRSANVQRKSFTPTELIDIGLAYEEEEKIASRLVHGERIVAGKAEADTGDHVIPSLVRDDSNRSRRIAAEKVGLSEATYRRGKSVLNAAKEDPEKFGEILDQLDKDGNYHAASEKVQKIKREGQTSPDPVKKKRHILIARTRHADPDRIVGKIIDMLRGICLAIPEVDLERLNPTKREEWSGEIKSCATTISKFSKRVA